jgi:hypothetical protein
LRFGSSRDGLPLQFGSNSAIRFQKCESVQKVTDLHHNLVQKSVIRFGLNSDGLAWPLGSKSAIRFKKGDLVLKVMDLRRDSVQKV